MSSSPPLSAPGTQSRQASLGNPLSFSGSFGPFSPELNAPQGRENGNVQAPGVGQEGVNGGDDVEKPWKSGEKLKFPLERKKDPWKDCHELVKKYDRALCRGWTDEINNLLLLSGLFSAVVTSFAVESYKWLQPDSDDYSYLALLHLSNQLAADPSNATARAAFVPPPFQPNAWQVKVNIFWFLSLVLSVTTAMIGILVIQWLREYERGANLAPKEALALRQMLHEGLKKWHVPKILYALPLLLQTALVLFFVGLLLLLWNINRAVAGVAGGFLALALVFTALTTIMPTLQFLIPLDKNLRVPQCPYKSLQSWAFFRLISTMTWLLSARIIPLGVNVIERLVKRWVPDTTIDDSSSQTSESSDPEDPRSNNRLRRQLTILPDLTDTINNMKKWYLSWWRYEDKMWMIPSWEGFDRYWRYTRDIVDIEDDESGVITNGHYDTIRGLQWVNKKLPLGVDATYVIHPCLLDLEIPVAVNALRVLSRTPKADENKEPTAGCDGMRRDSLHWLLQFYQRNKSLLDPVYPHRSETDPLHKDMVSLLAIRHLNSDSILHPDVRIHYLEMYIRIRNSGDDVRPFFELPLRHITQEEAGTVQDRDINNHSESHYIRKMFEYFDIHVPDGTMLQVVMFLLNDVRTARTLDFDPILLGAGNQPEHGVQGGHVTIYTEGDQPKIHERLREKWKIMQPVWKVIIHIFKHHRSTSSASGSLPLETPAPILKYCFEICGEMIAYIPLISQYDTSYADDILRGLCILHNSIGAAEFIRLRAFVGFEKLRVLANAAHLFLLEPQAHISEERTRWKHIIETHYLRQDSVEIGKEWPLYTRYNSTGDTQNGNVNGGATPGNGVRYSSGHAVEASDDTVVEDSRVTDL